MLPAAKLSRSHTHRVITALFFTAAQQCDSDLRPEGETLLENSTKNPSTDRQHTRRAGLTVATASLKQGLDSELCAFAMHCAEVSIR